MAGHLDSLLAITMDAGPSRASLSPQRPAASASASASPSPADDPIAENGAGVDDEDEEEEVADEGEDVADEEMDAGDISTDEDIDPLPAIGDPDVLAKEREQQAAAAKAQQAATVVAEGDAGKKIHGDAKGMGDFDLPRSIVTRIAKSEVNRLRYIGAVRRADGPGAAQRADETATRCRACAHQGVDRVHQLPE